eukprot:321035-Prorocentrum_minimum.AAC.1
MCGLLLVCAPARLVSGCFPDGAPARLVSRLFLDCEPARLISGQFLDSFWAVSGRLTCSAWRVSLRRRMFPVRIASTSGM